ncbi:hypothetical protein H9P43_001607 [Blastocladiella emersonii ATCC 22665]|nr:hypothetical protein H9P43_001607 [Blastocladiella emersonii ATCC 22665]
MFGFALAVLALSSAQLTESSVTVRLAVTMPFRTVNPTVRTSALAAKDSHLLGVQAAQRAGYLPGVNVSLVNIDTTGFGFNDVGQAIFGALEAVQTNISGIFGGVTSDASKVISAVTSPFRIPMCSYVSAAYDLSDKKQYPFFFRYRTTTPSDARGMISFMKKYGWSRFSIVQEGGYPVYQLLTEFLQRYAAAERMTVLGTTVLQASAANLEDTMATLREQLLAADARVICIGHLSSVAAKLLVHLYRHGFMATPPGMPRVFLFLNDPTYDLQILAPDLYPAILESAAIFSLAPQTLDNNRILPDFLAYYAARNGGMSYPYPSALGFEEGYACGFSMVYGLDQLVRTTPGATYADLAARSPALYARMNVSLFSVTEAAYPQFPLPLDASGDAIARYYYLRTPVVVPGTSVTNASYVVQRVDSIPPNPNVVLAAYAFPGMALGEVPPDASQKAMLNIHWLSASGIAITATVSLLAAGVLASFVVCIVFRERRPIWRSSLVSLVVVHVSTLLTLAYVLSMLGVPVPATCTARSVLSVWSPAILLACAASRLYPLYHVTAFRRRREQQLQPRRNASGSVPPSTASDASSIRSNLGRLGALAQLKLLGRAPAPSSTPLTARPGGSAGQSQATAPGSDGSGSLASEDKLFLSNALRRKIETFATALEQPLSRSAVSITLRTVGTIAVLYLVPTASLLATCQPHVSPLTTLNSVNHVCTCTPSGNNDGGGLSGQAFFYLWTALVQLILITLCFRWAWGARSSGFNSGEAKRWGLALLNAFGVLIIATGVSISAETAGRYYTFYSLLLAVGAATTLGILVGPIHLRAFSSDPRDRAAMVATSTTTPGSLHTESDPDLRDLGSLHGTGSTLRPTVAAAPGQHRVVSTGGNSYPALSSPAPKPAPAPDSSKPLSPPPVCAAPASPRPRAQSRPRSSSQQTQRRGSVILGGLIKAAARGPPPSAPLKTRAVLDAPAFVSPNGSGSSGVFTTAPSSRDSSNDSQLASPTSPSSPTHVAPFDLAQRIGDMEVMRDSVTLFALEPSTFAVRVSRRIPSWAASAGVALSTAESVRQAWLQSAVGLVASGRAGHWVDMTVWCLTLSINSANPNRGTEDSDGEESIVDQQVGWIRLHAQAPGAVRGRVSFQVDQ